MAIITSGSNIICSGREVIHPEQLIVDSCVYSFGYASREQPIEISQLTIEGGTDGEVRRLTGVYHNLARSRADS